MKKRVTSRDVAELAGVSRTTVSYVLNNKENQIIPEKTRQRVLNAAERLGYFPNRAAKMLKTKKADCISILVRQNIELPGPAATLQGIRKVLNAEGYSILLNSHEIRTGKTYPEYIQAYLENTCDGIIHLGFDQGTGFSDYAEVVRKYNIPFVMVNPEQIQEEFYTVIHEKGEGIKELLRRCSENGYRDFIYVYPDPASEAEKSRKAQFEALCRDNGYSCIAQKFSVSAAQGIDTIRKVFEDIMLKEQHSDLEAVSRIKERLNGTENKKCLVFPWQQLASVMIANIKDIKKKPAVAILAGAQPEVNLYSLYGGKVFFNHLHFEKCGETAAWKMIQLLNEQEAEKKTVIPNELREYN